MMILRICLNSSLPSLMTPEGKGPMVSIWICESLVVGRTKDKGVLAWGDFPALTLAQRKHCCTYVSQSESKEGHVK